MRDTNNSPIGFLFTVSIFIHLANKFHTNCDTVVLFSYPCPIFSFQLIVFSSVVGFLESLFSSPTLFCVIFLCNAVPGCKSSSKMCSLVIPDKLLKKFYESLLTSHVVVFSITHPESGQAFSSLGVGQGDLLRASLLWGHRITVYTEMRLHFIT